MLTSVEHFGSKLLSLVLILQLASGCTSARPIPPSAAATGETIRPGDKVRVVTRDGREVEFAVTAITASELVGELTRAPIFSNYRVTVAFSDIATIEKIEISAGKTAGLGLGIAATVLTVIAVVIAAAVAAVLGPGGQNAGPGRPVPDPAAP